MKFLFCGCLLCFALTYVSAQDFNLYWKYKEYDGAKTVTVPRWAAHVASWFLKDRDERRLLRRVHKVRVLWFEKISPITPSDWQRFARQAKQQGMDDLITVRTPEAKVRILGQELSDGAGLRKLIVLAQTPEGSALVSLRGKFRIEDINRLLKKMEKRELLPKKKQPLPQMPSVPVVGA